MPSRLFGACPRLTFMAVSAILGEPHMPSWSARRVRYLTRAQVERFFRAIPASDLRDRALFALMYRYGLRRREVAWLKTADIESERVWIAREKGGISGEYPVDRSLARLVARYRNARTTNGENPFLFPSAVRVGLPISPSTIYARFQRYARSAELPPETWHPHVLRHSVATHLLTAGWDLIDVKEWLGHRKLESTLVYLSVTPKRRESAFRLALASGELAHLR